MPYLSIYFYCSTLLVPRTWIFGILDLTPMLANKHCNTLECMFPLDDNSGDYMLKTWPQDASEYIKVFQVRHPLERFLSSYRFIFEREQMRSSISHLNKHIFETYPNINDTEFDVFKFIPSFRQFTQFVVDSGDDFDHSKYAAVSHWLPYYMSCNPCHPGN
jgi:hypothetical protein